MYLFKTEWLHDWAGHKFPSTDTCRQNIYINKNNKINIFKNYKKKKRKPVLSSATGTSQVTVIINIKPRRSIPIKSSDCKGQIINLTFSNRLRVH